MGRLAGYNNRIKITTKSTKVESDLIDFPLGLTLSSGCGIYSQDMTAIFDEVGNDYTKIAITSYDGETILPTEVEYWDEVVKEAQLWFKAPTVYSSVDTDFYLYYDATVSGNILIDTNEDELSYQLVISLGSEGTYDTIHASAPCVIKDGDTYKMWYQGYSGSSYRIIYCTSLDGVNWSNFQMVINIGSEGTYDTTRAATPFVIKDGDTYKMWYSGYNGTNYRIIYCTSSDGINWSNFQLVVDKGAEGTYDATHALHPCVTKENSVYKMWYSGYDGSYYRIIYCSSSDGINWSSFQLVVDKGSEGTYDAGGAQAPSVLRLESLYILWYTGIDGSSNRRILYCTSSDGINWSNFQMVIDMGPEGVYDVAGCHTAHVLLDSSIYKMWYSGADGAHDRSLYTSSPTPEWKTATQSVWDSSFKAVYHMNNDPSGGAGCVKDSTVNKHHGTPGGSMTSDDLINGRAVEFDGSDDYINCGSILFLGDENLTATVSFMAVGIGECICNSRTSSSVGGTAFQLMPSLLFRYYVHNLSNLPYIESIYNTISGSGSHLTYYSMLANGGADTYYIFVNDSYDEVSQVISDGASSSFTTIELGRWHNYTYGDSMFSGLLGEVRISDSSRSISWAKVESYTFNDSILFFTEDQIPYDYIFRGIIKEKGVPAQRKVLLYRRSNGELINSMTSSSDGFYYLTTPYNEEHYIVVLDDDSGDEYNALIQDRVYPSLT